MKDRTRRKADREKTQVLTKHTTVVKVMLSESFALGVSDVRQGRGFRPDYEKMKTNDQWDYERGRAALR